MPDTDFSACPDASLLRQLAAMIYDSLLIFAVLVFVVAIPVMFNRGEAIEWNVWLLRLYLLLSVFFYYAWFWHKSGQTLGMRAWKLQIVTDAGTRPGWLTCFRRLGCALLSWSCFGLGYLWRLFRPWTWHDRLSGTRIVIVPPSK